MIGSRNSKRNRKISLLHGFHVGGGGGGGGGTFFLVILLLQLLQFMHPDALHSNVHLPIFAQGFVSQHTPPRRQIQRSHATALSASPKVAKTVANSLASSNALRGNLYSALSKFLVSPIEGWKILQQLATYMHWTECCLISMWIVAPLPVARWFFNMKEKIKSKKESANSNHSDSSVGSSSSSSSSFTNSNGSITDSTTKKSKFFTFPNRSDDQQGADDEEQKRQQHQQQQQQRQQQEDSMESRFRASTSRQVAKILQQIGFLQAGLYVSDMVFLALTLFKFQFVKHKPVQKWAATIIISFWCARNMSVAKWHFIMHNSRSFGRLPRASFGKFSTRRARTAKSSTTLSDEFMPEKLGLSNRLLNRAVDMVIYSCALLLVIDILPFHMGLAFKSLFGLSSLGTLVFSLASKDVASECLASLAIEGSNLFQEGDEVLLYDGTQGIVQKMGWLHTHIRRGDEMVSRIPNSQIATNRIANVSRTRLSQVKQTLSIRYEDIDKLPQLTDDIKGNIRARCGRLLIDNGARPFRVHWREYQLYHIEVVIDAHFRNRPSGNAYWDLRQSVLYAIHDATQKNDVKFSYTNFLGSDTPLALQEGLR